MNSHARQGVRVLGVVLGVVVASGAVGALGTKHAAAQSSLAAVEPAAPPAGTAVAAPSAGPAAAAPAAPPAPYSIPWQLRSAGVANLVRLDTSAAFYKSAADPSLSGSTVASTLAVSYKVTPSLAPMIRFGVVQNQVPGPTLGGGSALLNPVVGVSYGSKFGSDWRYSAVLATLLPLGSAGDKAPGMDASGAALAAGIPARSGMDTAMFAVNYLAFAGGFDMAYVAHKLTVQAEATIVQLFRVRNKDAPTAADAARTNLMLALHTGYFVLPFLSLGAELRYQHWLSDIKAVQANAALREMTTVAVGPRFHFKVANIWLRPGISYTRGLDDPMAASEYNIVQLDLPVIF